MKTEKSFQILKYTEISLKIESPKTEKIELSLVKYLVSIGFNFNLHLINQTKAYKLKEKNQTKLLKYSIQPLL